MWHAGAALARPVWKLMLLLAVGSAAQSGPAAKARATPAATSVTAASQAPAPGRLPALQPAVTSPLTMVRS
jgi:hypothetical protein